MPPSLGSPDELVRRPGHGHGPRDSIYKPPLPTTSSRSIAQPSSSSSGSSSRIEIQLPPLIAGAIVASFAQAIADGLGNDLLTHYYLSDQKVRINLDRVLERLLHDFTNSLWDELFNFYHDPASTAPPSRQVMLLFDGPIKQIVLVLNGPETAGCLLDKLGPGLSRRRSTWSAGAKGIDLALALQLTCGYWHREFPALSPGGTPNEIARSLHSYIVGGVAASRLVASIRHRLFTPHLVQMHIIESAVWDIIMRRPFRPPPDGFNVVQIQFECLLSNLPNTPHSGASSPPLPRLGSLPALTGTATECITTSVSEYTLHRWPKCGKLVLQSLDEAVAGAFEASSSGDRFQGMSIWDAADNRASIFCPGLRFIHVEVEPASVRLSVSAWTHTLIDVFQQAAWTCAALTASPFPETPCESAVEVSDWQYHEGSVYVNCSLAHRPVPLDEGLPWLHQMRGAVVARGFPVNDG
jgi:hypothetical protein